jgi:hypothetical protein
VPADAAQALPSGSTKTNSSSINAIRPVAGTSFNVIALGVNGELIASIHVGLKVKGHSYINAGLSKICTNAVVILRPCPSLLALKLTNVSGASGQNVHSRWILDSLQSTDLAKKI